MHETDHNAQPDQTPARPVSPHPTRRELLGAGLGAGLLAAVGLPGRTHAAERTTEAQSLTGQPSNPQPSKGPAKNVIFLVVDGMSIGTFSIADLVMRRRGGVGSHWAELWSMPGVRRSMMDTRSADSLVTDSAAGGSAWGCGLRINNGSICFNDQGEIEPILVAAKRAGKSTGVVSTARLTHATPASFYATVPSRNMEAIIAEQMLARQVDVMLGGGGRYVTPGLLSSHADVTVVRSTDELRRASDGTGRLVGVFNDDHMNYELDRPETEPHIREMSMAAIERLARNPEGFVLQIEAGRVDHGGHANDFPASLHDQIAFEETVQAVSEWAMNRDDTLVIITTDHGTGGPELTVYTKDADRGIDTLLGAKHTLSWILGRISDLPKDTWASALRAQIAEHIGVTLSDEEIDWALRPLRRERVNAFDGANTLVSSIGSVMANHFGVAYVSKNHTAELVEATAFGPGSQQLGHRVDNYQLHAMMMRAMGLA